MHVCAHALQCQCQCHAAQVLEGNGYFAEMVFHTAVSACTRELLWWVHGSDLNKHKTTADPDGLRFGLGE